MAVKLELSNNNIKSIVDDAYEGQLHVMSSAVNQLRLSIVKETLLKTRGNKTRAAEILGINRATLNVILGFEG